MKWEKNSKTDFLSARLMLNNGARMGDFEPSICNVSGVDTKKVLETIFVEKSA